MYRGWIVSLAAIMALAACTASPTTGTANAATAAEGKAAAAAVNTGCPAQSFEEFLKRYASDKGILDAYTAPTVAVADYQDANALDSKVVIRQVPKSEYKDFTLKYENGAYHDVDAAGQVDPDPVDVSIERRGTDYYVQYRYGMSEGNSWLFKATGQCWLLTNDPDPPTS